MSDLINFSDLGAVSASISDFEKSKEIEVPKINKGIGLKQLERQAKKGYYNYFNGRALSPSKLKSILKGGGLAYLEACEIKRENDFNNWIATKEGAQIGSLSEDLLTINIKDVLSKYHRCKKADKGTWGATANKAAWKKALSITHKLPTKENIFEASISIVKSCQINESADGEKMIDLIFNIRNGRHQKEIKTFEQITDLNLYGFEDSQFIDNDGLLIGTDLKVINDLTDCHRRIFNRWAGYNYWLQPAVYDVSENYNQFKFVFSHTSGSNSQIVITLFREQLDFLRKELIEKVLIPFVWYLENGFEKNAPYNMTITPPKGYETKFFN